MAITWPKLVGYPRGRPTGTRGPGAWLPRTGSGTSSIWQLGGAHLGNSPRSGGRGVAACALPVMGSTAVERGSGRSGAFIRTRRAGLLHHVGAGGIQAFEHAAHGVPRRRIGSPGVHQRCDVGLVLAHGRSSLGMASRPLLVRETF